MSKDLARVENVSSIRMPNVGENRFVGENVEDLVTTARFCDYL
jgi:hypothetical protein